MKYENNTVADATVYLPLDTKMHNNSWNFIPTWCFHQVWILAELFKRTKHAKYTYLFNIGIFREQQMFFKWYGGFTEKH
jgi:3-deoxy-D-manno-octulosonic-acid transferase